MSPRIAYWATSFESDMEALASEVSCLRRAFPKSVAWGVSQRKGLRFSWRRGYCFHPRFQLAFRAATWALQGLFDINHVFGGVGDWFHLKAIRRSPTLLTMAVASGFDRTLVSKVDRFVVEWPDAKESLQAEGIEGERIDVVFPPVDLKRFHVATPPAAPFTALFASSPEEADWLSARGVDLLLDAAALRPKMRFKLVWRPWGNSLPQLRQWIAERELTNVEVAVGRFPKMETQYQSAHVTVVPFTRIDRCKPAPNSLIESLAAGRPVVVTECVGLSSMVGAANAGVCCAANAESLAESLDRIEADWQRYSCSARRLAEDKFAEATFLASYERIYARLLKR